MKVDGGDKKKLRTAPTSVSPRALLEHLMHEVDDIENVSIVVCWRADSSHTCGWSYQKNSDLLWASNVLLNEAMDKVRKDP